MKFTFMKENVLLTKSFDFAVKSVNQYKLLGERKEFVLSKQFLRSSISVGANVHESNNAQSKADFIHKLYISQKEYAETLYWLELLKETNYLALEEFEQLSAQANELLRIIKSIILTTKRNLNI